MDAARPGTPAAAALTTLRNLKPHRPDRRYLDSYRSDVRDVKDLACQLQVYLDPRAGEKVAATTVAAPEEAMSNRPRAAAAAPTSATELAKAIADETGQEPLVVDLVTPDIDEAGFAAVRVLSPGLVPNYPAAFPQYGAHRVIEAAVLRGYDRPIDEEDELHTFPLAHY
jgi:ribosomal protein S12 methylthiotransferase accessory factor